MKFLQEIFWGDKNPQTLNVIRFHLALFLASGLFVYFFSTSTSPHYNFLGDDSSIFQAVGKGWAEGLLPYVDLFENKGPLIFLIDALGYMIYPRVGIMFLQVPMMYLSFLFAWRSLGLFLSGKAKIAASALIIVYYALYSIDGNRTEEWSMPFLMVATYCFLRGIKEEKFFCPPLVGFIYGLGFGVCTLLRMINGLPICCYAFLSLIFLIQERDFNTLRKNFLNFCAGFMIICLPFVIYFAAHGALYDMLYGTILLNVVYSAQRENYLLTHLEYYAVYIVENFMPLYLLIVVSVLELIKDKNRLAISGLFSGAAMLLLMFKLSPYFGYCTLNVPMFVMFFVVLAVFLKRFSELWSAKGISLKRILCKIFALACMIYPLLLCSLLANQLATYNSDHASNYNRKEGLEMTRLAELIPLDERGSVMIWSEGFIASHWILTTGIFPCNRFFDNVKAFAKVDPNVKREWLEVARDNPPQWIIYSAPVNEFVGEENNEWKKAFRTNRDTDVERLLQDRYNLADEMEMYGDSFLLYRLKR